MAGVWRYAGMICGVLVTDFDDFSGSRLLTDNRDYPCLSVSLSYILAFLYRPKSSKKLNFSQWDRPPSELGTRSRVEQRGHMVQALCCLGSRARNSTDQIGRWCHTLRGFVRLLVFFWHGLVLHARPDRPRRRSVFDLLLTVNSCDDDRPITVTGLDQQGNQTLFCAFPGRGTCSIVIQK